MAKSDPLPPWEKSGPPRGLQRFVPKLGKKPPEGEIAKAKEGMKSEVLPSGIEVVYKDTKFEVLPLTAEERRQRREDNRRMREIHSKVRRRKPHGRN